MIDWTQIQLGEIVSGVAGGFVGAGLTQFLRYMSDRRRATSHQHDDFHIAATIYRPLDPLNPFDTRYADAMAQGKTHIQELLWLGHEVPLDRLVQNTYIIRELRNAMNRARDAGLLLGMMPESCERPLLKKLAGQHSAIPSNDIVGYYKRIVGTDAEGRVHGISPPTHEHYNGSPHRRVMRAMFIADSQIANGLPPADVIHFGPGGKQNRYKTLSTIIAEYRADPDRFENCRVYF